MHAQTTAERLGNRLFATSARLTQGRLAAARGDWPLAQQHALAHLDACAEGGHTTYVPACLDALAEIAAGLHRYVDAARLLAAAERVRAQIGTVRVPPEDRHWAAIDRRLRDALPDSTYAAARAEGAQLSTQDALEWARRARGPRGRPPAGWASLTPTEARVLELATDGLSNRQIAERMFISPRDRQDPPRPHLQEDRRPQPRRTGRTIPAASRHRLTSAEIIAVMAQLRRATPWACGVRTDSKDRGEMGRRFLERSASDGFG